MILKRPWPGALFGTLVAEWLYLVKLGGHPRLTWVKLHGPLPSILITTGQRGDSPQFEAVLAAIAVPRLGPGPHPARPGAGRQCLRVACQPRLPAAAGDPVHDSGEG
jgi:hypothetical protein